MNLDHAIIYADEPPTRLHRLSEQEAIEASIRIPPVRRMKPRPGLPSPPEHHCPSCGRRQATRWECDACRKEWPL